MPIKLYFCPLWPWLFTCEMPRCSLPSVSKCLCQVWWRSDTDELRTYVFCARYFWLLWPWPLTFAMPPCSLPSVSIGMCQVWWRFDTDELRNYIFCAMVTLIFDLLTWFFFSTILALWVSYIQNIRNIGSVVISINVFTDRQTDRQADKIQFVGGGRYP
jgi:hypothetical protein